MRKLLMPALLLCAVVGSLGAASLHTTEPAIAQDQMAVTNYPTYVLQYRKTNRWVSQDDKEALDDLSRYAKRNKINSFRIVLPDNSDNNLYIERLLILSRIMKSRLRNDTIVFRQELGQTPPNTISVTPAIIETATGK